MRRPTLSQERTILRGVIAKTRLDFESLVIDSRRTGRFDQGRAWGLIERLDKVMDQFGIEREKLGRQP